MKVVVIGGTGLIGKKLMAGLAAKGHEAVSASRSSGVNTLTGDGLASVLAGADVVVDVSNSPSLDDGSVMEFFTKSTTNVAAAAKAAGVGHFVALSIVGIDRMPQIAYMRAKTAQEDLIKSSGVPYTIVRATQFYEFAGMIVGAGTNGGTATLSNVMMQPIAADDVADAVLDAALAKPTNRTFDIAGPQKIRLDAFGRQFLAAQAGDPRQVVTDPAAGYFGNPVDDQSLVPLGEAKLGTISFAKWLAR